MYYEEHGQGNTIIFIHGSLSTGSETFRKQIPYFSRFYKCICLDLKCHGMSRSDSEWTSPILADDIAEFMNKMNIRSAHLIGHSMGGDIAMYCAVKYPEKVSSVVLISDGVAVNEPVISYLETLHPDKINTSKYAKFISKMENLYGYKWKDFVKQTIHNCSTYPTFSDDELKSVNAPLLLIRGGKDSMVLDSEIKRLQKMIPNTEYRLIENGDHFLHIRNETCDTVNKFISQFLNRIQI